MSLFAVRQGGPGDEEALAALDALCFGDGAWSLESFEKEMTGNPFAVYILAETVPEEEALAAAGSGDAGPDGADTDPDTDYGEPELMGYVGLWMIAGEGHITNVAVHPDHRGQGVAKVLLKLMLDYCEEQGISDVTLEVRPSNEPALRLYRGFGFREEGRRPHYYENDGEDALILWRRKD